MCVDRVPEAMENTEREQESALERELTAALQHVDAPAGFADRVMARLNEEEAGPAKLRGRLLRWPVLRPWFSGAAAAALIAGLFATQTAVEHHRARERRVQQATAQFELAERITDRALQQARRQIQQAGVPLD